MDIKSGNLTQEEELKELKKILFSRMKESSHFSVSLAQTKNTNLAQFSALVNIYVTLKRMNKTLQFSHCYDSNLKEFINKTQFNHVFTN